MELQSRSVRIASYRKKLPRKAKNIYLPTEVWVDVFCYPWISRPRMGKIVYQIGNRWFGEQLQFYLHEWGKHTLGELHFKPQGVCKFHNGQYQLLEFPQTAIPENIKFYKSFQIDHFNNQVFNFFRRIQSVLLAADTKLHICYNSPYGYGFVDENDVEEQLGNVRTILGHLLPLINGIHTISTDDRMLPVVKQSLPSEKFHQIKVLDVEFTHFVQSAIEPTMEWFTTSNEPKVLQLRCINHVIGQQVLLTIRKQFIEATEPSTFAVVFCFNRSLPNFHSENGIGEQLVGIRNGNGRFEVFRHQANAEAGDQLRQWVNGKETDKGVAYNPKQNQCIRLSQPTIGSGNIFALPDSDEADQEENEKPSTSKKQLICE